jgi:hypothetical protein
MKKHFFSHLVAVDELHIELDNLEMSDDQKEEVKKLLDESIYHTVLEAILMELSDEDKKIFLTHLLEDDHGKIWEFVNGKVENIEDKIVKAAEDIKKELHSDIKQTK